MKNKAIIISILAIILLGFTTCKKTPEVIDVTNKKELPTISTNAVSNITFTTAISGGDITSDGNSKITTRGVCWSISDNPTLENNLGYTSDGIGTGSFTSSIMGLTKNTTYYVSAYAINEKGTSYGQDKSFITQEPICGQFTVDYGGQLYQTVQIGTQCWMEENLNIGTRINGSQEMQANSSIEKYCYGDNDANCVTYGGLYQWNEMMQYSTQEGIQGICPDGWHIPTDNEWKEMEMELGMSQSEADNAGFRGTNEGEKLKSTSGWSSNGNGTNSSGFGALPGGTRNTNGSFNGLYGSWWSSSESSGTHAWGRFLYDDYDQVYRTYGSKAYGRSVRCLKD